jgi:GH15 family glucan-1,4-alpha-glucosidase
VSPPSDERPASVPPVARIEDYALIGDTRTAALCSYSGCIDWLCLPIFDSEPVFGRLVGGDGWGTFAISPVHVRSTRRRYLTNSSVLETTWETATGSLVLTEGMVLDVTRTLRPPMLLVRRVGARDGPVEVAIRFDPRLRRRPPRVRRWRDGIICTWDATALHLRSKPALPIEPGIDRTVTIEPGSPLTFAVSVADRQPIIAPDPDDAWEAVEETRRFWARWADDISYDGPARDAVVRSLLTLRLLTFSPSGAPVAAPTSSLPESLEGNANWDYRYAWPRDASIGVETFLEVGQFEEAESFLRWMRHATRLTHPRVAPLYTIYGRPPPAERELSGAAGYEDVGPVLVGNRAARQRQLDVPGWVMEAAWRLTEAGRHLDASTWRLWSRFADFTAEHAHEPDAGIWEERGRDRHHVHSKLMSWRALERACTILDARGPGSFSRASRRRTRWAMERDRLAAEIPARGFDPERGSYKRDYDSTELDAAVLSVLPDFEPSDSSRLAGTIAAIRAELSAGGVLLYRFPPSSRTLGVREGAFLACSFWLVGALARAGRVDEAREVFDGCSGTANDVGLFAEEIDPATGRFLGNFPQALSHATMAQAALALDGATTVAGASRASRRKRRERRA